jgi:hypothetical protein
LVDVIGDEIAESLEDTQRFEKRGRAFDGTVTVPMRHEAIASRRPAE